MMRRWIEDKTGLWWGTYTWHGRAPILFLAVGPCDQTAAWFEIGFRGRQFYVAPRAE